LLAAIDLSSSPPVPVDEFHALDAEGIAVVDLLEGSSHVRSHPRGYDQIPEPGFSLEVVIRHRQQHEFAP
jgi:hypothetical protein